MSVKIQLPAIANEEVFEEFILDLYNLLYPAGNFQRFGKKGNKQKGVDLISFTTGIAVQCKKKELTRTGLLNELKKDLESAISTFAVQGTIKQLIVVSTFDDSAQLIEHAQALKVKYNLPLDVSYLGWQSISASAQQFPALLQKYYPALFDGSTSKLRTPIPYFEPELLLGREPLLKALNNHVGKYQLCVLQGIAGVGKTVVLSCYVNSVAAHYNGLVWAECQADSLKEDIIAQFATLLGIKGEDEEENWKELMAKMKTTDGNNLVVLNGLDFFEKSIDNILEDLCSTGWKVIVTSRIKLPDQPELVVEGIPIQAAKVLFRRYYTKATPEELLERILRLLETHPLLVELVAKSANANLELSLEQLYPLLSDTRIKSPELQRLINVGKHSQKYVSDRYQEIFRYVLLCFDINSLNEPEKTQLTYFSVLQPSAPIAIDFYQAITQQEAQGSGNLENTLNLLTMKGWIDKRKEHFYIHPLVQDVAMAKLQVNTDMLSPVIATCTQAIKNVADEGPWNLHQYIIIAGNILNAVELNGEVLHLCFYYATALDEIGNYGKSILYFKKAIDHAEKTGTTDPAIEGGLHNNLGNVYLHTGWYDEAKDHLLRAIELLERDGKSPCSLGHSIDNLATVFEKMGRYQDAIPLTKKAIRIFQKQHSIDDLTIAYVNLANTYINIKNFKNAILYWKKGMALVRSDFPPDHRVRADYYLLKGIIYQFTHQYVRAKKAFLLAVPILEKYPNDALQALLHTNLANAQIKLFQFEEARHNLNKAMIFHKSQNQGSPHNLGLITDAYGDYYVAKEKYNKAAECFMQALKLFDEVLPEDHPDIERVDQKFASIGPNERRIYIMSTRNHQLMYTLLECLFIQQKFCLKIIDRFGEFKTSQSQSGNPTKADVLHDYVFFCFTKCSKSLRSISVLIRQGLDEDAMILLHSVYRNYLTILYVLTDVDNLDWLVNMPLKLSKGMHKHYIDKNGVVDNTLVRISKSKTPYDIYPRLSLLAAESPYEEDKIVHEYLDSNLSEHAYSSYLGSGNFRNNEQTHYSCNSRGLIVQPAFWGTYLQLLVLKEMVQFLKDDDFTARSKQIINDGITILKGANGLLGGVDPKLTIALTARLNKL